MKNNNITLNQHIIKLQNTQYSEINEDINKTKNIPFLVNKSCIGVYL